MVTLKLTKGEGVKLYGPMSVVVKTGFLEVHGRKVVPGERFVIHKTRNYVAEALEECELDITMVDNSQIQPLEQEDPYWRKREIVKNIVERGFKKIVVIGCVDCGKTAMVTLLYNALVENGHRVAVLDGDVGQADIGPPGFITLGTREGQVFWMNELKPVVMKFVGDIKPQYFTHVITRELEYLVSYAFNNGFSRVVVDTDGWIGDEHAILYKQRLVETLKPDVLVVIGDELEKYFRKYTKLGSELYAIKPPVYRKVRTREERRLLRSLKYRDYLEGAPPIKLKLDDIVVSGLALLQGVEVDLSNVSSFVEGKPIYASQLPGTLYVYGVVKGYNAEELKKLGFDRVRVYPPGFERGLYCAVEGPSGFDFPCVIEKVDFETREVVIRTRYANKVEVLKISRIKLTEEFTEEYTEV